jgi:hypothetical protein
VFERTIWMTQRLARLIDRTTRTSLETGITSVESSTADLVSAALQPHLTAKVAFERAYDVGRLRVNPQRSMSPTNAESGRNASHLASIGNQTR